MNIISARYGEDDHSIEVVTDSGTYSVPASGSNRHYRMLMEWVAEGNTIAPYVAPPVPTNAELVDMAGPVLVAFLKAYAEREGLTLAQIRDAIVAKM